jgi:hypothetical protein
MDNEQLAQSPRVSPRQESLAKFHTHRHRRTTASPAFTATTEKQKSDNDWIDPMSYSARNKRKVKKYDNIKKVD